MKDFISIPQERLEALKDDEDWRKQLKKLSDVDVEIKNDIEIEHEDPVILARIKLVFTAFGRGFSFDDALNMIDEDYMLDVIDIKSYSKSENRMKILKGRIIGTKGKIKNLIEKSSNAKLSVHGKTICVIGRWDEAKLARAAVDMILLGSKHSTVIRYMNENKNL